jgi:hypothetical protein
LKLVDLVQNWHIPFIVQNMRTKGVDAIEFFFPLELNRGFGPPESKAF